MEKPTREELIKLVLSIRDVWVPRLENIANEGDKVIGAAHGIRYDIVKQLPEWKFPKEGA